MSITFDVAVRQYQEIRQAYEEYREAQYARAVEDCNCVLITAEARKRGVDEFSLFMGPQARAYRWASEELREWWATNGRLTFAEFEAQHLETWAGVAA